MSTDKPLPAGDSISELSTEQLENTLDSVRFDIVKHKLDRDSILDIWEAGLKQHLLKVSKS